MDPLWPVAAAVACALLIVATWVLVGPQTWHDEPEPPEEPDLAERWMRAVEMMAPQIPMLRVYMAWNELGYTADHTRWWREGVCWHDIEEG